jgi:hypothetical protein
VLEGLQLTKMMLVLLAGCWALVLALHQPPPA